MNGSAGGSVTVTVRIKANQGMEDRVEEELRALLPPTRAEQGCIYFDLHRDVADGTHFLMLESWTSEEDLDRHLQTPHVQAWLAKAGDLLAEPMELTRSRQI